MRCVMARVFPVPAPASTQTGPSSASATWRWLSSRAASKRSGLTTGDVAMYSSKRIFNWTEGNYVVSDEFGYVVDYDEVAPFAKSSFFAFDNIVNGFVNADGWPLIINFPIPTDGLPEVPMQLW